MKVTMFWHGGSSYAMFDTHSAQDAEQFDSLRDAINEFQHRYSGHDRYYPCVENPTAWIFFGENIIGQDYPDRVLTINKRGSVHMESA